MDVGSSNKGPQELWDACMNLERQLKALSKKKSFYDVDVRQVRLQQDTSPQLLPAYSAPRYSWEPWTDGCQD